VPGVFVSVGSNIDRETNVRFAVQSLRQRYGSLAVSSICETAAVGFDGEPFYNLVVGFDTDDAPEEVRAALRHIEHQAGRRREGVSRFSSRTLDLDMILYGDLVRHDDVIDVPAAEIGRYDFVLGPLAELAPDHRHPERHQTFAAMWERVGTHALKKVSFPLDAKG